MGRRRPNVRTTHLPVDLERLCAALGADLRGAQNAVQMLRDGDHDGPHGDELVSDLAQWGVEIAARIADVVATAQGVSR